MKAEVVIIDGNNFCYRHAHTRATLRTTKGYPTGAIYGTLSGLTRLGRHFPRAHFVFVWDGADTKNSWRNKIASHYKENRRKGGEKPQAIKDIAVQIPVVKELFKELGFASFEVPEVEADDLIGILTQHIKRKVHRVLIYSTDKDFFQLMDTNVFVVRDTDKTQKCKPLSDKEIHAKFGVESKDWLRFRSITGDSSDNIPKALPGVGPSKALKLLEAGLDPSKQHPPKDADEKLKQGWELLHTNWVLSKILRKANSPRLPQEAQAAIGEMLKALPKPSSLARSQQGMSRNALKSFISFCVKHELQETLERKDDLWKIGK